MGTPDYTADVFQWARSCNAKEKTFLAKCEAKLEIPKQLGGGGVQTTKPTLGRHGQSQRATYFWRLKFTPSVFFWVKRSVTYFFRSVWLNKLVLRYLSNFVIFLVQNFDARYFFGCKISGSCIFGGFSNMKLLIWSFYTASPLLSSQWT